MRPTKNILIVTFILVCISLLVIGHSNQLSGYISTQTSTRVQRNYDESAAHSSANLQFDESFDSRALNIQDSYFTGKISLTRLRAMTGYRLKAEEHQTGQSYSLHIKYPVYRFDAGDINDDGKTDVLIGVVKKTHFEQYPAKRLFIMQIDSNRFRPLWLGSRVCLELIDFKYLHAEGRNYIFTIEQNKNNSFCNGLYLWQNFGLELKGYKNENSDYVTALHYFNR